MSDAADFVDELLAKGVDLNATECRKVRDTFEAWRAAPPTGVPACQSWCGTTMADFTRLRPLPEYWRRSVADSPAFCSPACRDAGRPLNVSPSAPLDMLIADRDRRNRGLASVLEAELARAPTGVPDPAARAEYVRQACDQPETSMCECGHAKGVHLRSRYVSALPGKCHATECACDEFQSALTPTRRPGT